MIGVESIKNFYFDIIYHVTFDFMVLIEIKLEWNRSLFIVMNCNYKKRCVKLI